MDNDKMLWYRTLHFPIPDEKTQRAVMDVFREAVPNLVNKHNKPYVWLLQTSRLYTVGPVPLSKGSKEASKDPPKDILVPFTVIVTMAFRTYSDIVYYDHQDPGHKKIKQTISEMKFAVRVPLTLTTHGWMAPTPPKNSIDEIAYVFVDPESEDDKKKEK